MTKDEIVQQAYKTIAEKFDARDRLYELLELHLRKHGSIPSKYLADWNTYQRDKRKWREIPGMKKKLWKLAKISAKNLLKTPKQKAKTAEKYLDKQLKKINGRIAQK